MDPPDQISGTSSQSRGRHYHPSRPHIQPPASALTHQIPRARKHLYSMDRLKQNSGTTTPIRGDRSALNGHKDLKKRDHLKDIFTAASDYTSPSTAIDRKCLRLPRPPRPPKGPQIPRPPKGPQIPRKWPSGGVVVGSGVVVGTGLLSVFHHFFKKAVMKTVQLCYDYGKILLVVFIAYTGLRILLQISKRGQLILDGQVPPRVALIVCTDIISHDSSRNVLLQIVKDPRFRAIFPTCVMEGLRSGMESIDANNAFRANAARKMVFDVVRLGNGRFEDAAEPECAEWIHEYCWESSDEDAERTPGPNYEDSILTCARNERTAGDALVFIVTNSGEIKARATAMLRKIYP